MFSAYGAPYTTGDVIEMLLDLDNGRVSFTKNGVPQGIAFAELGGQPVMPAVCVGGAAYVPVRRAWAARGVTLPLLAAAGPVSSTK